MQFEAFFRQILHELSSGVTPETKPIHSIWTTMR